MIKLKYVLYALFVGFNIFVVSSLSLAQGTEKAEAIVDDAYVEDYVNQIEKIKEVKGSSDIPDSEAAILSEKQSQEAAKQEALKQEALKQEALKQASLKQEALRQEDLRQEELKQEELKQEELRQEELRQEELRQEELRQEELRQEELRQEELRQEELRQEELKQEALEQEVLEQETAAKQKTIEISDEFSENNSLVSVEPKKSFLDGFMSIFSLKLFLIMGIGFVIFVVFNVFNQGGSMGWFVRLSLQNKIIVFIAVSLIVVQIIGTKIFINEYENNLEHAMFLKAKAIGQIAENARIAAAEALVVHNAFKVEEMVAEAGEALKGLTVGSEEYWSTLRGSRYYNTGIPVVWAFKAAREGSERSGFKFKPTRFNARNKDNEPHSKVEKELQKIMDSTNKMEISKVDKVDDVLRYMRPVILSKDCMLCHGKAEDDPSGNGSMIDPIGFAKDDKVPGDRHGSFQIIMDLKPMHEQVAAITKMAMVVSAIVILICCILVTYIVKKSIVAPIVQLSATMRDGAEQVNSASGQISNAAQQLSQGATEQASSLEETSSSLDEISSMVKSNADNAAKANQLASEASKQADQGNEAMQQLQGAMEGISDSSGKIGNIIKTIEEIAFQTNLLALNAAVEAARAGEHGKGFAVVADEVRNLAQRSAVAAKDTAELIEDSVNKAKEGSDIANKAGDSLAEILESSKKVADVIAEIAAASKEQSEGVSQVTNAISQMDQVTQQNAASSEETASASEELNAQAGELREMIQELESVILGKQV